MELLRDLLVSKLGFDAIIDLLIPLSVGTVVSIFISILHYHFIKKTTLSMLNPFQAFPSLIIIMTTLFCVLQVSIGLSLGLIGSLSLVRFRAAIKSFTDIITILIAITISIICAIKAYLALLIFLSFVILFFSILYFLRLDQKDEGNNSTLLLSYRNFSLDLKDFLSEVDAIFGKGNIQDIQLRNKNLNMTLDIHASPDEDLFKIVKKFPDIEFQIFKKDS